MTPLPVNPLLDLAGHPVVAHRGASAYAPENTLPAFRLALEQAADACEFDVHLSADGVPVVIHDSTLDRTTDRTGFVAETPLAAIREADAGYRFTPDGGRTYPYRGQGIRVPTLVEVIETLGSVPLLIELKTAGAMEPVARVLTESSACERCVVASFDRRALATFHAAPFIAGASRAEIAKLVILSILGFGSPRVPYRAIAVPPRHGVLPVFSRRMVKLARRLACPVHVWTVDDPKLARQFWEAGAAGLITNVPDVILRARREAGLSLG